MSCDKYSEWLALHAIDELRSSDRQELERHLMSCEECRKELTQLRTVVRGLSDDSGDTLSEVERLGIEREVFRQLSHRSRRRIAGGKRFVRSMIQVAAALAVFVTGYGVKSIINGDAGLSPEIRDRIELGSHYGQTHASAIRFSTEGLKLITKGKRSWNETSLRSAAAE